MPTKTPTDGLAQIVAVEADSRNLPDVTPRWPHSYHWFRPACVRSLGILPPPDA